MKEIKFLTPTFSYLIVQLAIYLFNFSFALSAAEPSFIDPPQTQKKITAEKIHPNWIHPITKLGKNIKDAEIFTPPGYKLKTIVIDPGHGGHDPGCSGSHTREKHLVLAISKKFAQLLKQAYPDLNVILTRDKDVFIPLHKRAAIANEHNADLFISIHCNFMPGSAATKGTETFVMGLHTAEHNLDVAKRENASILFEEDYEKNYDYDPNSPEGHIMLSMFQNAFLERSILFAERVEAKFGDSNRKSRGVKQAGFVVLKETATPSVLVEAGFLSHKGEERFLSSKAGQEVIAFALLEAFTDYKNIVEENKYPENNASPVTKQPIFASRKEQTPQKMHASEATKEEIKPEELVVVKKDYPSPKSPIKIDANKETSIISPEELQVQIAMEQTHNNPYDEPIPSTKTQKINSPLEESPKVEAKTAAYYTNSKNEKYAKYSDKEIWIAQQEEKFEKKPVVIPYQNKETEKGKLPEANSKKQDVAAKPKLVNNTKVGKTKPKNTPSTSNIQFCIQLSASPNLMNTSDSKWQNLKAYKVEVIKEGSLFKYQARNFKSYRDASKARSEIQAFGFKDAFLVAYKNGKRIPIKQAINEAF